MKVARDRIGSPISARPTSAARSAPACGPGAAAQVEFASGHDLGVRVDPDDPYTKRDGRKVLLPRVARPERRAVAEVLAGGPIRGDQQGHRAVACVAEQPPAFKLASLLVWTNRRSPPLWWRSSARPPKRPSASRRADCPFRTNSTTIGVAAGRLVRSRGSSLDDAALLSNLDRAVDDGAESAARTGAAEARDESCLAVEKDDIRHPQEDANEDPARRLLIVQGDNANTGQPGTRNHLRSSRVRSTAAGGRFWAIARATSYWARARSGRLLFGEALAREG